MDYSLDQPKYFLLLAILPILGWVIFYYIKWKKSKKKEFADTKFHNIIFEKSTLHIKFIPVIYLLAIFFIILSLVNVLGGKEKYKTTQPMNNIIILLDVSNSMNAEDCSPSRIALAKNIVLNSLKNLKNDRIGIVVFAGNATSIMPLTSDYSAVETYISAIDSQMMKVQGTDFLRAMETAIEKMNNVPKGARKIILISDGEDNEGNEDKAIELAKKEGITVFSVGVGTDEGAPIPIYLFGQLMGYKTDRNGQTVLSHKQTKALKKMANETGGNYIDGNNLNEAVLELKNSLERKKSSTRIQVFTEHSEHYFQYLLIVAVILLLIIYFFNPKRDFNL